MQVAPRHERRVERAVVAVARPRERRVVDGKHAGLAVADDRRADEAFEALLAAKRIFVRLRRDVLSRPARVRRS